MNTVSFLINEVARVRQEYVALIAKVNEKDAQAKPAPDVWNTVEITEHLFWAEQGAILGMWKTLHAIRDGKMERTFESIHKELPIQTIIDRTWKAKEQVPPIAAPRMGGTLIFWRSSLNNLQHTLEAFGNDLQDNELRVLAHPHPLSGPLDFQQRLEFLAFHIRRHYTQAERSLMFV
jgi:DinB superfamily